MPLVASAANPPSLSSTQAAASGSADSQRVDEAPQPAAVRAGLEAEGADRDRAPKIRSGLVVGLALGGDLGRASGYPNNAQDIGNPNDYADSGAAAGLTQTLVVMGALADSLNFGFFVSSGALRSARERSTLVGVGLRLEAFPFVTLVPALSGLGGFTQFGLGSGKLQTSGGSSLAQGTQSFVGAGALYEWSFGRLLGGHFGAGPSLEYDAMWSRPFQIGAVAASARVVFYGGD